MKSTQKYAVLYLRVSTEEQLENYSLKTQEDICRREAARRDYIVEKIFTEEGKSAKSIVGRPVLINLLEYCRKKRKKINALIVYRLDRLSRQTGDYLAIRKKLNDMGIVLISTAEPTGDSPTENLIETILAGFAQLDNDIRGERSRNGMYARFMSGLPNGIPPVGYVMVNGYVMKDVNCFDKMKKAWDLMATGTKSSGEMAKILNNFKLKNSLTGKLYKFRRGSVFRIFRSKYYMGIISSKTYQKEVQGQYVPMISKEQYDKVQSIFEKRSNNKIDLVTRNRNNADFPLRRFVKCGRCNKSFTGGWSRGNSQKYAYYACIKRCKNSNLPRKLVHDRFTTLLKTVLLKKEEVRLFMAIFEVVIQKRLAKIKQKQARTASQLQKLRELRQSLFHKNLIGVYSDKDFKEQLDLIENQLQSINLLTKQSALEKYTKQNAEEYITHLIHHLPIAYEFCDITQKRTLMSLLYPDGLTWNYPGLIVNKTK